MAAVAHKQDRRGHAPACAHVCSKTLQHAPGLCICRHRAQARFLPRVPSSKLRGAVSRRCRGDGTLLPALEPVHMHARLVIGTVHQCRDVLRRKRASRNAVSCELLNDPAVIGLGLLVYFQRSTRIVLRGQGAGVVHLLLEPLV